jgi:hypothetical protein
MLTRSQAINGVLVTGIGGGSGGNEGVIAYLEENYVPIKALTQSSGIENEIDNSDKNTSIKCTDSTTNIENLISVTNAMIELYSQAQNYAKLRIRPNGVFYIKKDGAVVKESEIATLDDILSSNSGSGDYVPISYTNNFVTSSITHGYSHNLAGYGMVNNITTTGNCTIPIGIADMIFCDQKLAMTVIKTIIPNLLAWYKMDICNIDPTILRDIYASVQMQANSITQKVINRVSTLIEIDEEEVEVNDTHTNEIYQVNRYYNEDLYTNEICLQLNYTIGPNTNYDHKLLMNESGIEFTSNRYITTSLSYTNVTKSYPNSYISAITSNSLSNKITRYIEEGSTNKIEIVLSDSDKWSTTIDISDSISISAKNTEIEINSEHCYSKNPSFDFEASSDESTINFWVLPNEIRALCKMEDMFYCVPRTDFSECDFYVSGDIHSHNVQASMTITHETDIEVLSLGRFCETTGLIYSKYKEVGIKDCITGVKVATTLSTKLLGIITSDKHFASHGDVLVKVVDGEYHLGDLLIPTENGARVANEEEKLFIMINGLPKVRVMSIIDNRIPKINDQVCAAAFIS